MHQIPCPWCGVRDETEFQYQGDATVRRPAAEASEEAYANYVYFRENPKGVHIEYWRHTGGCRRLLVVERDTVSHDIKAVRFAHIPGGGEDA
ncbi:MAG: sarcosine oxidase subunit delta [Pseudomonadota bacterium]